jgi:hypothetical protein
LSSAQIKTPKTQPWVVKKKLCLGFGFSTQTCKNKTANYKTLAAQLTASGDAVSNSSLQLP